MVALSLYYRELLGFLSRKAPDRATAADLAQESYARVVASQRAGAAVHDPRALLYKTARHLLVDEHRRGEVRARFAAPGDDVVSDAVGDTIGPAALEPEVALASRQMVDAMLATIDALPPRCRQAFVLHKFDGLPQAEVATQMGISVKMVEAHIQRAMLACRQCRERIDGIDGIESTGGIEGTEARSRRSSTRRGFLLPALFAAAMSAVLGRVGLLGWRRWQAEPVFAQSFSTPRGEQREVLLPDGTRLRLDTATRVDVRYFRDRRELRLPDGQAVFSVARDADRPFTVLAGPLRVTVVGTRFSVRHTPGIAGDDGVRVAVEEGLVKVERVVSPQEGHVGDHVGVRADGGAPRDRDAEALFLSAGQQISCDAQGLRSPVMPLSSQGIAPWRDHRVSFDNARLDQVLAELARYGDTRLVIRDPAVAGLRLTGTFNPTRLDTFARVLPQALPVKLREAGGMTEIARAR